MFAIFSTVVSIQINYIVFRVAARKPVSCTYEHSSRQFMSAKRLVVLTAHLGSTQRSLNSWSTSPMPDVIQTPSLIPSPSRSHSQVQSAGHVGMAVLVAFPPLSAQHPHSSLESRNAPSPMQTDLLDGRPENGSKSVRHTQNPAPKR